MHGRDGSPEPLWHAMKPEEAISRLKGDAENGLELDEAQRRLMAGGRNRLQDERKEPLWEEFLEELREPMVLLLLFTGVLYALWGERADALTILAIILTLTAVEVFNERRSERAIAALRKLAEPTTLLRRSGRFQEVPVEEVVPGDLIVLQAGRRVPADARLWEAHGLAVDESSLTGESVPVDKEADCILAADTPLAERRNLVYFGTLVTRGRGLAVVTATGMGTELARVSGMARQVKEPRTPLQRAMDELSGSLVWLAIGFSALTPALGLLLAHQPLKPMLLTGLSLAFATIPEEMPIIITMVLALGAYRLSKKRVIVKRLKAVEALGAVTVIATDKTGTLTENRVEVVRLEPEEQARRLLEIGALCNDAVQDGDDWAGDPLDTALLRAAQRAGLEVMDLRLAHPLRGEFAFDNARRRMSAVYRREGRLWAAVKGAPEAVLAQSTRRRAPAGEVPLGGEARRTILEQAAQMAAEGLRVIAMAEKALSEGEISQEAAESDLTFVGLIGLADPPRPEARRAIALCQRAGIRPLMITGDHPLTARAIAREVGLDGEAAILTGPELDRMADEELQEAVRRVSIYARMAPEHKLRVVKALKGQGARVAVTGDGVNDAPALAAADIGVAMGETGSDVAREAGDIVLADDNFATIVSAVEEGRLLFANLRKGVRYYLACKVALVLITLLSVLLLAPVPFAPVQIILMELFMDLAAAATFVVEPAEAGLLDRPPRDPRARFLDREMAVSIFAAAGGLFAAVSAAYLTTWYGTRDLATAQTTAFFAWLLGHVLLAFNLRSERQPIYQLGPFSNRPMVLWGAALVAFLVLALWVPGVWQALRITSLDGGRWGVIIVAAVAGTFWLEGWKVLSFRR